MAETGEKEQTLGFSPKRKLPIMTLQKAVEMGEYDPDFLSMFPEWHQLTPHLQFRYIKEALDNRYKQLMTQWAEINNVLDFTKKPEMHKALKNIEDQIKKIETDREKLYFEYSKTV